MVEKVRRENDRFGIHRRLLDSYGEEYVPQSMEEYEAKIKAKMFDTPKREAAAMGFQLSPIPMQ